jgi:O-antigen/teichoic acid export membrane protein
MSLKRYAVTNIAGGAIPVGVMVLTVPLYLKELGQVRYGVLSIVWLLLGYFALLEMGLGRAVANQLAKATSISAFSRNEIFWTALLLNALFGVVGMFGIWTCGSILLSGLHVPAAYGAEADAAIPWIAVSFPLALTSSVLVSALEGRSQFGVVNTLQVLTTVVFQIFPLAMTRYLGGTLDVVIPAAVASRALMNIPFFFACVKHVPITTRPVFSIKIAKSLFGYGAWVAVTGVMSPLMETMDRLVVGAMIGAEAVTHYTLPYQAVSKIKLVPLGISRALFPELSVRDQDHAKVLATDSIRVLAALVTPIVVSGMAILPFAMDLWIGRNLSQITTPIGVVLLCGAWANSLAHIPFNLLEAQRRPHLVTKLHAAEIAPFLLILAIFIFYWGVPGAALAWTIRTVTDAVALFALCGLLRETLKILILPGVMVALAALSFFRANASDRIHWTAVAFVVIVTGSWAVVSLRSLSSNAHHHHA